jgi:phosphohistidine phosphatase SixA
MKRAAIALLTGMVCVPLAAIAQETLLQGKLLAEALRQGGYVILIRHAASDKTQKDAEPVNLTDCATQRNLSKEGQTEARTIGQEMNSLKIPIGKVLSSPYCRTMDTGRLAFSRVESSPALNYVVVKDDADKQKAAALMRPLLATAPESKTNTILISHSTNIQATLGFVPDEGEAVIFKPEGSGRYKMVSRVRTQQWNELK